MMNRDNLVSELEFIEGHNVWLSALFSSIKAELSAGRTYQAKQLADIGHYLVEDSQYHLEETINAAQPQKGAE